MRASFLDEASIKLLERELDRQPVSAEVISSLIQFNSDYLTQTKLGAISKLKGSTPLFVLTGQQVGLFGGPLLTFYKAVSAIKAAKILSEKLNRDVLPVFWLQSEDHDLEEISSVTIISAAGEIKNISLKEEDTKSNRKSVSEVQLNKKVLSGVNELQESVSSLPYSEDLLKIIERSYAPDNTWSKAFYLLFSELFKDTELLFFDINALGLKSTSIFKQVIKKSFSEMAQIESLLTSCTRDEQVTNGVHVKPNSPLSFIDDESGNRFRLTLQEDGKFTANSIKQLVFTEEQILETLENEPQRFSTSALLRPLVQDSLFRTIAYVGGDAELQYHRQLDKLYPYFGLTPPLLLSRGKFRLLGEKTNYMMEELQLSLDSYNLPNEKVAELLRATGRAFGIDSSSLLGETQSELNKLSTKFQELTREIDTTLEEPLKKTTATAINAYTQFISRLTKASIQKDSVTLNRIEKVRSLVFPFSKEQERELGLVSILARTGPSFIEKIEEHIREFNGAVQTLVIEEI